ncbi:hypothetical protein [Mycobacterium sp. 1245111.1]|uniref:hypothetical protein n=1 Tax=Mycobacterium sp. 1245111.1 TaxID=1834073 RepID=UPI0012EA67F4|nr:hypothetical protein [Mycobacterium sp. 1245111.1]
MDLLDMVHSVFDAVLWVAAIAAAIAAAVGVWRWLRWRDVDVRIGCSAAVFVVSLVVMAGVVRPAIENAGQPSHEPQYPVEPATNPWGQ